MFPFVFRAVLFDYRCSLRARERNNHAIRRAVPKGESEKTEHKLFGNLFFNSAFCLWEWALAGWRDTAVGE